ncbi:MAG: hypothetical protein M4579_000701 [Chaenotheca gracillima]|nr:MAG: hypothetical protein M4579_000701 [Chaenotheca gracillima]
MAVHNLNCIVFWLCGCIVCSLVAWQSFAVYFVISLLIGGSVEFASLNQHLEKKDNLIQDLIKSEEERNSLIQEFVTSEKEKNTLIQEFATSGKEKDTLIQDFTTSEREKDTLIQDFEIREKEKDTLIQEYVTREKEKNTLIQEHVIREKEKNALIQALVTRGETEDDTTRRSDLLAQKVLRDLAAFSSNLETMTSQSIGVLQEVTNLRSQIKQHLVERSAIPEVLSLIKTGLASPDEATSGTSLSALSVLFKRLGLQDPDLLARTAPLTFPLIITELGTNRERQRALAFSCLTELWQHLPRDIEDFVKENGITHPDEKTRQASSQWLSTPRSAPHFSRRLASAPPTSPRQEARRVKDGSASALKSDARRPKDASSSAPKVEVRRPKTPSAPAPKVDTRHQKDTSTSISTSTSNSAPKPENQRAKDASTSASISNSAPKPENQRAKDASTTVPPKMDGPHKKDATISAQKTEVTHKKEPSTKAGPPYPKGREDEKNMKRKDDDQFGGPLDVQSAKELEEIFRDMYPSFEGRESEGNWYKRQDHTRTMRRLTAGNAPTRFPVAYHTEIKGIFDGILKAVNSLRTTLASGGCLLICDIASYTDMKFDQVIEMLLQTLVKMSGNTKKLNAQNGTSTMEVLITETPYNVRFLHHIWNAAQEKNAQLRGRAPVWLKLLIETNANHKGLMDHNNDIELVEKTIRKTVGDSVVGVREGARKAFYVYQRVWPTKAETLFSSLDANIQKALENDPANPKKKPVEAGSTAGPKAENAQPKVAPAPKSKIREAIKQRRKAAAVAASTAHIEHPEEPAPPAEAAPLQLVREEVLPTAEPKPSQAIREAVRPVAAVKAPEPSREVVVPSAASPGAQEGANGAEKSAEAAKKRRYLEYALEKLGSGSADLGIFRRLQGILREDGETTELVNALPALIAALLVEFGKPEPTGEAATGQAYDLKVQGFYTIRHVCRYRFRLLSQGDIPRILRGLIAGRKSLPNRSHILMGLQETAEFLVSQGKTEAVLEVVKLQIEEDARVNGITSIAFGLMAIESLLTQALTNEMTLSDDIRIQIAGIVLPFAEGKDHLLRAAGINCCLTLRLEMRSDDRFYEIIGSAKPELRSLIMYYAGRLDRPRMPGMMNQWKSTGAFAGECLSPNSEAV